MVAVIKYNAGNVHSVLNALSRLGAKSVLTDDESEIRSADRIIFPGVGEASSAIEYLRQKGLDKILTTLKQPFLGICLGMQLMTKHSSEGDVDLLSIFPNDEVVRFPDNGYKIPQIGWNTIEPLDDRLFYKIPKESYVYFVHSYYVPKTTSAISLTSYDDILFSSAIARDNYYGVQFHPEKSGDVGERILRNFLELIK